MLIIQPTADGRLRIQNNHRSELARDEASARSLAYNWGHTDVSINKALSEMRATTRGESSLAGWRAARPASAKEPAPAKEPTTVKQPGPVKQPLTVKQPGAVKRPARRVSPVPPAAPAEPAPSAAKLRGERRARKAAAAQGATPEPKPAAPRSTPVAARQAALEYIRAGVKELLALEAETLPFARAPWSDLREMAEYISACLDGKKPRTAWTRENPDRR